MKQIEKVSIGGYVFTLETEAAAETERYLKEMGEYYSNPEITDGIEERMAELLRERVADDGVVSKSVVLSIIDILGRPERIAEDEPETAAPDKPAKKLYRDMENAKLAGVCSGIGAYFRFDPVILRVAFIVLTLVGFFGLGDKAHFAWIGSMTFPVLYIILWICIPAARTARQRWELRGDDGSAESVRRNIESGASDFGNAVRQVGNAPAWATIGRILEVGIGLLMLIVSVSALFAGGLALFGWEWLGFADVIKDMIDEMIAEYPQSANIVTTPWVGMLAIAVYALPFIGMLYGSILMLFKIKAPSWHPGMVIMVVWIIAVIAFGILVAATFISPTTVSTVVLEQ